MASNVIFFGWNRPIPGRERISAGHFQEFVQYLGGLRQKGAIESFDIVFLEPHGGDMNGFFLIRGESARLAELVASSEWVTHMTRAVLHLQGPGVVPGVTGDAIQERMNLWTSLLPA
jgi:hypothetical protein